MKEFLTAAVIAALFFGAIHILDRIAAGLTADPVEINMPSGD